MTIAIAWPGAIVTASRPIDTVGSPSPITPLTNPASRNAAVMKMSSESCMGRTLTDRPNRHNLDLTENAFGRDEGMFDPHPEEPRSGVSKDAGPSVASWFEMAQERLLTM